MARSTCLQRCAISRKRALGLAAVQRHCRHTYGRRRLVAPWVATIVLASFLWASVGFWAIFTGVLEISAAVRLRREIKGEIWLALSGLLSIILGAIVLWIFFTRPVESFVAAGWLLGFHAAVYGVTLLFLSWSLRKRAWGKSVPNQNLWI